MLGYMKWFVNLALVGQRADNFIPCYLFFEQARPDVTASHKSVAVTLLFVMSILARNLASSSHHVIWPWTEIFGYLGTLLEHRNKQQLKGSSLGYDVLMSMQGHQHTWTTFWALCYTSECLFVLSGSFSHFRILSLLSELYISLIRVQCNRKGYYECHINIIYEMWGEAQALTWLLGLWVNKVNSSNLLDLF